MTTFKQKVQKEYERLCNLREIEPHIIRDQVTESLEKLGVKDSDVNSNYANSDVFPILCAQSSSIAHVVELYPDKKGPVLIGKGVCFDSGGYNIKTRSMEDMFFDKTGAILALMVGVLTRTKTVVAFVNNMINNDFIPGMILKSLGGKHILIGNTDAEGRLLLADLLDKIPSDRTVITLATLTGAAAAFMGTGGGALLHTTDKDLQAKLVKTFPEKHRLFPAPVLPEYDDQVLTKVTGADITNDPKPGAGSQAGYSFLKHFHPADKLIHVDLAAMMHDHNHNALGWGLDDISYLLGLVK